MGVRIFGYEFDARKVSSSANPTSLQPSNTVNSPVPPDDRDGALNISYGAGGGYYGYYLDLDGTVVDDFQIINRYREMQLVAEVDEAIDQICNELVIQDAGRMPVSLDMSYVEDLDEKLKFRIQAEFNSILKQINFHKDAYSIIRQWYVDGRIFYHLLVDEDAPQDGIKELRLIDPRTIRKVREVSRKRHDETQVDMVEVQREYYVFNPMGFVSPATNSATGGAPSSALQYNGIKLTLDSVAFCPSGLYDSSKRTVLSWLHKAIKPLNLLRMIEDSCIIYRVSRAAERRVFYIDVGNLPAHKAEEYMNRMMQKYKNKMVYDVATGEMRDDRKFMSIMEDFWLPRKEGGKGTEITTLPAGQNLSQTEDVDYFRRKLYRSLGLPPSRIDQGTGFSLGRSTEISRDELRFTKFIHRLQIQFNTLFDSILEKQLRLKNVLTEQEWFNIKDNLRYKWQQDSHFEELKAQEIWTSRLTLLQQMEPYINRFFSENQVARDILKYTDDEWAEIREDFDQPAIGGIGGDDPEEGGMSGGKPPFGKKKSPFGDFDAEADEILGDEDEDEQDELRDLQNGKDTDKPDKGKSSKPKKKPSSTGKD